MAPSEETNSATCSQQQHQQQEQDVAGAELHQDSPKFQQGAPTNCEENINCSASPDHVGDTDPFVDSPKSVTNNCTENMDSLAENLNSDANVCVENINLHMNSPESGSSNSVGNTHVITDGPNNVDSSCKEIIDNTVEDSSQTVRNIDHVVDRPRVSDTVTGSVGQCGDSPKSVVNFSVRNNDKILDGPKKVATNCAQNVEQVVTSSKSDTAAHLENANEGVECPVSVLKEDEVVDSPKYVASLSVDNSAKVMDRPENKDVGASAAACIVNIACAVNASEQHISNLSADCDSRVTLAAEVDDIETAKEGKDVVSPCTCLPCLGYVCE
jgi:hypothetical protein